MPCSRTSFSFLPCKTRYNLTPCFQTQLDESPVVQRGQFGGDAAHCWFRTSEVIWRSFDKPVSIARTFQYPNLSADFLIPLLRLFGAAVTLHLSEISWVPRSQWGRWLMAEQHLIGWRLLSLKRVVAAQWSWITSPTVGNGLWRPAIRSVGLTPKRNWSGPSGVQASAYLWRHWIAQNDRIPLSVQLVWSRGMVIPVDLVPGRLQ